MTSAQMAPPPDTLGQRGRRFAAATAGWLPLLALVAIASWVYARYALQVKTWQPDEVIYVSQGRALAHDFPGALWNTHVFNYGIERLNPILGALTTALFAHTSTAMQAQKVLTAIAFASTAVPIYLLARSVAVGRIWALAAGALAIAVPWAPLMTSFLNDPLGYPTFAWALYGCWRAATFPGWQNDLIALATVVAAALARSNLAVLGAALVLAILATELRYGRRGGVRATATGVLRDHIPVAAAVGLGLLYLLVKGHSAFAGAYPVDFIPPLHHALAQSYAFIGFVAQGLMLAPVIVATAWTLRHLFRPLDRERFALAATATAVTLTLLYSLVGGVQEERYVFELAPLMTLLMVVAVARRDVPVLLVGAAGIAVALLVSDRAGLPQISAAYLPFAYPGQTWWQSVVRGRAAVYLPGSIQDHVVDILLIGVPVLVVAAMLLVRRFRRAGLVAGGALIGVQLALGIGAAGWALHKYVNGAGDPHGATYAQRSWVDQRLHKGDEVGALYAEPGPTADGIVADTRFWNDSFDSLVTPIDELVASFDPQTGELVKPLPRYILVGQGVRQRVGLGHTPLASSPLAPVQLWQTKPGMRAGWILTPGSIDGWSPGPRARIDVRTWGNCVQFSAAASPDQPTRFRWLTPGRPPSVIELPAGGTNVFKTSRPGKAALLATSKGKLGPGVKTATNVSSVSAIPCA